MERLRFEFLKLCSLKILPFLLLIFLLSFFFVNSGIGEYKNAVKELETDIYLEVKLSENQFAYDQYGIFGHRIFILPSPLIMYFDNSSLVKELESSICTAEIIKIYSNLKGDKVLKKSGSGIRDFGGILDILGTLLMLLLGVMAIRNRVFPFKGEKRVFRQGFLRLLLLDIYFLLLMLSMYLLAVLNHIRFSPHDSQQYLIFMVVTLFYLNMWFLMGMGLAFLMNYKSGLFVAFAIWALILIGIPELRYMSISKKEIKPEKEINLIKMNRMWKREANDRNKVQPLLKDRGKNIEQIRSILKESSKEYLEKEGKENKKLEQELLQSVIVQTEKMEDFSSYLPWSFYQHVQESMSSKGYETYNNFVDFTIEMRDRFFRYILDKRYNAKDKKVIPFFKRGENVYHSRSILPRHTWRGLVSILVFSLMFIGISVLAYLKRRKKEAKGETRRIDVTLLEQKKSFFFHCETQEDILKLANYVKPDEQVGIIEPLKLTDYDPGTRLIDWINYICAMEKIDLKETLSLLDQLQVTSKDLKAGGNKITGELLNKVYYVLKLGEKKTYYFLLDFFRGESANFEITCKKLLKSIPSHFLYLSTEPLKEVNTDAPNTTILGINWLDKGYVLR